MNTPETLHEFIDSRGLSLRVDREPGVIRGVKILGLASRNGRGYLAATLAAAASLYEGAKVNVNHPKGDPAAPRDYQDRIGVIRNVTVRPREGLFGDLHFNPKHALAEQLAWDAEHAPENVGFSHNVEARTARQGEHVVVEAILKVKSVDLVADPATTQGLFEGGEVSATVSGTVADPVSGTFAGQSVHESTAALPAKVPDTVIPDTVESELAALREEVERLRAAEAQREKRAAARRIMAEFDLPDPDAPDARTSPLTGGAFLETVLAADDEAAMRRLVAERAGLLAAARSWPLPQAPKASKPTARDQQLVESNLFSPPDVRGFVRAIT